MAELGSCGEADWLLALKRESVIGPLASRSRPGVQLVEEAALELGLGRSVLYDLLKRYRLRPQTSSLLPGKRGREPKLPILRQDREQLLGTCIQEFYLKPERPRLAALMLEVQRRFAEQSLSAPNYRTVCRRVESLDLRIATMKREGSKKAGELFGPVSISTLRPEHPMDVLQIDHTPVDVIVVDQRKRLPIGRPWLTLAIDVRTRMVAGFHVSLWSPSTISLSLALSQAVSRKPPGWLIASCRHSNGPSMDCRERFMSTMPRSSMLKRWCAAAKSIASVLTTVRPGDRTSEVT